MSKSSCITSNLFLPVGFISPRLDISSIMPSTSNLDIFLPSSLMAFLIIVGLTLPAFFTASKALVYFWKKGSSAADILSLSTTLLSSVSKSATPVSSCTFAGEVVGAGNPFVFKKFSALLICCCVCRASFA